MFELNLFSTAWSLTMLTANYLVYNKIFSNFRRICYLQIFNGLPSTEVIINWHFGSFLEKSDISRKETFKYSSITLICMLINHFYLWKKILNMLILFMYNFLEKTDQMVKLIMIEWWNKLIYDLLSWLWLMISIPTCSQKTSGILFRTVL